MKSENITFKIRETDKAKKLSPIVDDHIKQGLNEHNLTEESRHRLPEDSSNTITATFETEPKLTRVEDVLEAYDKLAADLHYNRRSWYHLPDVSADGKKITMIFDMERDLDVFKKRLESAGYQIK
ncbi:hypothetical protein [Legionella yabuuchiae]|uniref:hypothetical protein n=1 Tax=Legionella yabuuchiae TaxID=376727 RepID=UPI001054A0C9|nr:hypothetical protein [Legionella yabuuchiae]